MAFLDEEWLTKWLPKIALAGFGFAVVCALVLYTVETMDCQNFARQEFSCEEEMMGMIVCAHAEAPEAVMVKTCQVCQPCDINKIEADR